MKNFFEDSRFLYGASVAPYAKSADWPAEEYEQDMKELEKLNFNVIRIFVPQDRIEYAEHRYDFSRQDAVMDLAARHGIGVLLTVGGVFDNLQGIYPPQWLARDYPVLPPQDRGYGSALMIRCGAAGRLSSSLWLCAAMPNTRRYWAG